MNQYKVTYRTLCGTAEKFVEAKSEAQAMGIVQSNDDLPLTKIRAKEVYNPTATDYHNMKEICIFLACVCVGLLIVLIFR